MDPAPDQPSARPDATSGAAVVARVGLREIAQAAGVSVMAVSLALRDNPKISLSTRAKVQRLAAELGYQPDPEISRLMRHLRTSRTSRGRTGLAIVDLYGSPTWIEHGYNAAIRQGAKQRAEQLGLNVTMVCGAEYQRNFRRALKVIRARGLEGVILLPPLVPMTLEDFEEWNALSVVATTNSILAPRFHSVVPHQFANMMRLIENLQKKGCRSICAIFDELFDGRTAHHFTAALKWHQHGDGILILPESLGVADQREVVDRWVKQHQPDAVFLQAAAAVRWAASLPPRRRTFALIGLGSPPARGLPYIDERPEVVGAAAADLIAGMMYYHEVGIPEHPRTTMIDAEIQVPAAGRAKAPAGTQALR